MRMCCGIEMVLQCPNQDGLWGSLWSKKRPTCLEFVTLSLRIFQPILPTIPTVTPSKTGAFSAFHPGHAQARLGLGPYELGDLTTPPHGAGT